jgi:hypothetical protein
LASELPSNPAAENKFTFEINFYLPEGKHTPGWLAIKTLPYTFSLISGADMREKRQTPIIDSIKKGNPFKGVNVSIKDRPFNRGKTVSVNPDSKPYFKLSVSYTISSEVSFAEWPYAELVQAVMSGYSEREVVESMQLQVLYNLRRNQRSLELEAVLVLDKEG